LLLDSLILVGSILHLIVVYYLVRFGILAEIVGLLKIRIKHHSKFGVSKLILQPQFNLSSMASSTFVSVFDNYRFKTAFNEELYNTIVKNKKVIAEVCFDLLDDEYPKIREQIVLQGWRM
ncbi:hypothetical protein PIB30_109666, partial [Stylosanthes scabra]|nr:hypothetical protein [Stylosanthes scabra]